MNGPHRDLARLVRDAYAGAVGVFYNFDLAMHTSQDSAVRFYADQLDHAVQELATKLLASFDCLGMSDTSKRLKVALEGMTGSDVTYSNEVGEFYSPPLEAIRPYLEIIEGAVGALPAGDSHDGRVDVLEQMLRNIGRYLYMRQVTPTTEPALQAAVFPMLRAAFASTRREWPIPHPAKVYKVDFAIAELNALIELKFCKTSADWPKAVDGIYADMKGYAVQAEWRRHYAVFYLTDNLMSQDEAVAEFNRAASATWKPIVVFGSVTTEDDVNGD